MFPKLGLVFVFARFLYLRQRFERLIGQEVGIPKLYQGLEYRKKSESIKYMNPIKALMR